MEEWSPEDPRRSAIVLRRQLIADGFNDRAIARLVGGGELAKVRRGAYVAGPAWKQLDEPGRHSVRARAVLAQAGTDAVLSHATGLLEYDVPSWGLDLSDVHVTRPDQRAGRREAGVRQHRGVLLPGDLVTRNGVAVLSPTRLGVEITTVADTEACLVVVNHLLHEKLTDPEALHRRCDLMTHWPGSLKADLVLRLADGRVETVGETRTYWLCYRCRLPMPIPQYEILDASGRVIARVDFAWPEHGVFLEFDGRVKYEKLLKPGERPSDVVIREKRREELICRITGWRCVRIVWSDLARPEQTAEMLRAALFPPVRAA